MYDIIRFHVPCKLEYTKLVEDMAELLSSYLKSESTVKIASKLRAVMNEVFINIVKHSHTAAKDEIVRFQFEIGFKHISISIYDYGPGFKADDFYPPYPKEIIGKKYKLREVIDGSVYFTVIEPFGVSFNFEEREEALLDYIEELSGIEDHGMGLSIITKLMDTVTYTYIGEGKYDWKLIKKLE